MSNRLHETREIDIVVLEGENGTVHINTSDNIEDAEVASKFDDITSRLGDMSASDTELPEPDKRQNNSDLEAIQLGKMVRRFKGRPERPTKIRK